MTREQKLALVLGFAAVLIVGLLISDHMAATRSAVLDEAPHDGTVVVDATEGQALRRVVTLPTPVDQPRDEYRGRPVQRLAKADLPTAQTEFESPIVEETVEPEPMPIVFRNSSDGGIESPGQQKSVIGKLGETIANGLNSVGKGIEDLTGSASDNAPVAMGAIENLPRHAESRSASVAPVVVQHHVQPNESLYKIAEKYYGDGNQWRTIAKDNEGRVADNGAVREGVTLRIVDPKRGLPAGETIARDDRKPAFVPVTGPEANRGTKLELKPATKQPQGPMTYTVQSGDTLGEISQKLLGTVRRQHELIALNRDVLKDPDHLRAGMVLKLPSS